MFMEDSVKSSSDSFLCKNPSYKQATYHRILCMQRFKGVKQLWQGYKQKRMSKIGDLYG